MQLNTCVVLICKGEIVVMGVCLRRFCLNIKIVGDICFYVVYGVGVCVNVCVVVCFLRLGVVCCGVL